MGFQNFVVSNKILKKNLRCVSLVSYAEDTLCFPIRSAGLATLSLHISYLKMLILKNMIHVYNKSLTSSS